MALVDVHVGFSHLMGADREEASLGAFCTPEQADTIVSHWRSGSQSLDVVGELFAVWLSLWRSGIWAEELRKELSDQLADSYVNKILAIEPPGEDPISPFWSILAEVTTSGAAVDDTWDTPGTHLAMIRNLETWPDGLVTALLPLERRAILGARRDGALEASLESAIHVIDTDVAILGGWGGPRPQNVPRWLRDYAIARGGRIIQDRAGVVPCWFLITESPEELRAVSAWRYSPRPIAVATYPDRPGYVALTTELDFGDGGPPGVLEFVYNSRSRRSAASLDMLAWVELVRLEVYTINESRLEYAFSHGVRLADSREALVDPEIRDFPDDNWFVDPPTAPHEILFQMRNADRVQFELIRSGERAREGDTTLSSLYIDYLQALDEGARSLCVGVSPDVARIDRARRELQRERSFARESPSDIHLDELGTNRGILQVSLITDEPMRVRGAIAYHDDHDVVNARLLTIAEHSYALGRLEADEDGLAELLGLGLTGLVLSPSGPLYGLPLHEDFLDEGILEVSYAHCSEVIAESSPQTDASSGVLVAGWQGDSASGDQLSFLEAELLVLENTYGVTRGSGTLSGPLPSVVHLAGHGMAGESAIEHWLRAWPSLADLVTPARVLLEADASSTDLVFLSACSSGRGVFGARTVMEAIPLDVAFLERGAKCVVSTSAPVNDAIAAAFSIAFHVAWRRGSTIWEAYMEARTLTSRAAASSDVLEAIQAVWPTWKQDLEQGTARHPEDWRKFRLSGRHW
ncbi:CHAT domain-containing protein [Agromyces tropicus]